jgi:serine/threonine-protein kinase RsbW
MATVELSFTPLPAHVRTARLVAAAVARRSGVDESLLDEVRLAVGEACSRAVEEHRLHCPTEPVRLALTEEAGRFEVEVTDTSLRPAGPGGSPRGDASHPGDTPDPEGPNPPASVGKTRSAVPGGFGIAVIAGLADDVQISETSAGTSIRMSWPSAVTAS